MMVHLNSTNFEIYAYNLDMTEFLVFRVFTPSCYRFWFLNSVRKENSMSLKFKIEVEISIWLSDSQ